MRGCHLKSGGLHPQGVCITYWLQNSFKNGPLLVPSRMHAAGTVRVIDPSASHSNSANITILNSSLTAMNPTVIVRSLINVGMSYVVSLVYNRNRRMCGRLQCGPCEQATTSARINAVQSRHDSSEQFDEWSRMECRQTDRRPRQDTTTGVYTSTPRTPHHTLPCSVLCQRH